MTLEHAAVVAAQDQLRHPGSRQLPQLTYGACGLPYYVAGINDDIDLIRIRKKAEFEASGIHVQLGREAVSAAVCAAALNSGSNTFSTLGRASTTRTLRTRRCKQASATSSPMYPPPTITTSPPLSASASLRPWASGNVFSWKIFFSPIPGIGGALGEEPLAMTSLSLHRRVRSVRVVEALPRVLNVFDPEFSAAAQAELEAQGASVHTKEAVRRFLGQDGRVTGVETDQGTYPADVVVLSIGVSPNTAWLDGLEKLPNGAIVTNGAMETSVPDVYAAGDCASVMHRLLKKPVYFALGTNANKQGRLAGDSVLGRPATLERALGTSMLRCAGLELAKTGLGEEDAKREGIACRTKVVKTRSHARYYPDPCELTVKLVVREADNVLLGAQIMGAREAVWRINVFACAIDRGMTAEELGCLDMGYAPPFAGVWDAVQIAANAVK